MDSEKIAQYRDAYSDTRDYDSVSEEEFYEVLDDIDTFFFLVGFPKAATTTLYSILAEQPSVSMSPNKEPPFFSSDEFEYGMGFYWEKYYQSIDKFNRGPVVGEASTTNSFTPFVSRRIAEKVPEAKIVFSIRNPVDRAFSNWWMYRAAGLENLTFDEAVEWELKEQQAWLLPMEQEDHDFWKWYRKRQVVGQTIGEDGRKEKDQPIREYIRRRTPRTYLMRGYYALHIKRFQQYFPDDQIHVVRQDRLRENRDQEVSRLLDFLEVEDTVQVPENDHHVSKMNKTYARIARGLRPYKNDIPDSVWDMGRSVLGNMTSLLPGEVKMKSSTRETLFDYYRDKNRELEQLLNEDFSAWNEQSKY